MPQLPVTDLRVGVVIEADIAFEDSPTLSKRRPAVVLAVRGGAIIVAPCTTMLRDHPGHLRLHDWLEAGLRNPSDVLLKLRHLDRTNVVAIRGQVTERDWLRLVRVRSLLETL